MNDLRFNQITLLSSPEELPGEGTERLETILRAAYPEVSVARPHMPYACSAREAVEFVRRNYTSRMQQHSLLVGLGQGGLIACAIQSDLPALRLSVVAVNAPTEAEGVIAGVCSNPTSRVALYSCAYKPIKDRCDWKTITPMAYDVPWLAQGITTLYPVAYLIAAYSRGLEMDKQVSLMFPA